MRASASQSVDLGFIPLVESYQKTFKNGIHSFPAWRSALKRDSVENKPASLLVVSLGKTLNGTPPPLCGRQVALPYCTGYNCEVANPVCPTTLGYPPVAVRFVGGGVTSHSRLVQNGLPSFSNPNFN